ncbi:MAG: hypothetical protein K6A64_10325 [Bacteroidales bacterium]|nr:hypothetical protein [Bacteroidales bacterium]
MGGFCRIPVSGASPAAGAANENPEGEYNSDNAPRMTLEAIKAKLREALAAL